MNTIDAASCVAEEISAEKQIKNNIAIQNIHLDDLVYLEKDLDFYEKVSLVFLLCAKDRDQYKVQLQQLLVLSFDKTRETDLLRTWASAKNDWKHTFVEALCLIQAKHVIKKLGLDYADLHQRFLPSDHYTSSYVHVIVKLLYYVCEELTVKQSKKLVDYMQHKYASIRNFIYDGEFLEIYIMNWFWENVIDIGQANDEKSDRKTSLPCNLEPIIQWLKENEFDSLKEIVKNVAKQFNGKMQTDDKQATVVEETFRSFESMRLPIKEPETAYKIRSNSAGILLIINQKNFEPDPNPEFKDMFPKHSLETRHGTDRDADGLDEIFRQRGYQIRHKNDRSHIEILNDVRDVINESVKFDSVIVCLLSHGYKGIVYGANCVPVLIEDIEKLIITDRLIGKPKILIIQACQGEVTQRAKEIEYLAHDGPSDTLPVFSDFLTCVSTVPGFTSIRHTQDGSWFIQTLCAKIKQFSDQKHFVDILTVVIREVLNKRGRGNQCMVPIFKSTLRLDLYFPSASQRPHAKHSILQENKN